MCVVPLQDGEQMTARFSYSWSDEENNQENPATHLITTTLAIESLSAAASGQPLDVTPPPPPEGYTTHRFFPESGPQRESNRGCGLFSYS